MIQELGYCNGIENYSRYLSEGLPESLRLRFTTICRKTPWLSQMSRMSRYRS